MNASISPKGYFSQPERRALLAAFATTPLPGDRQMLSDATLLAALQGHQRLLPAQRQALLTSPLTLCRLRYLEGRRLAAVGEGGASSTSSPGQALARWERSACELLAATTEVQDVSLYSPDGLWALHALTTGTVTRILLQLRPEDEGRGLNATARPQPGDEVAVLDGAGTTLLMGRLDDDGELEAPWIRALDLRSHLSRYGRLWSVVRA